MPPRRIKTAKITTKQTEKQAPSNSIQNYMDTPAKRTRSASGKIQLQGKMASQHNANSNNVEATNNALTPIQEIKEATTKEGFVAELVEQINNSPNVSPVKGKNANKNREQSQLHQHVKEMQSTVTKTATLQPSINRELNHVENQSNEAFQEMAQIGDTNTKQLTDIFAELNTTMQGIQSELRRLNSVQQEHTCKVSTLEFVQKDEVQSMRKVQAQLEHQQQAIDMLVNHVTKQDQRISELTHKQNEMQARSMKRNILISGIPEHNKEDCAVLVDRFFTECLCISRRINIKIAHRIGSGSNRPMVVKLKDGNDKQLIFQHTSKLKGTNYFVSEQLPEEINENKKLHQRLRGQNKQLPAEQQLQVSVKKDKVFINNELFKPAISAPSALDWLTKSEEEKKSIKRAKITKGGTDTQSTSTFVSYAAEVRTVQEVQKAYDRVFTLEPRATHIVCAYLLPGQNFPMQQGCVDDREFGVSRQLLRKLQSGAHFHRAVFVARYYGGTHLGADRFRIYKDLAQMALDKLPAPTPTPAALERLDAEQMLRIPPMTADPNQFTFNPPQSAPIRVPKPSVPLYSIFTTPITNSAGNNKTSNSTSWGDMATQDEETCSENLDDEEQELAQPEEKQEVVPISISTRA